MSLKHLNQDDENNIRRYSEIQLCSNCGNSIDDDDSFDLEEDDTE